MVIEKRGGVLRTHGQRGVVAGKSISQNHRNISNNSNLRQKHLGVQDRSDGSDATSYPPREYYTLPVAQATCLVAYIPPL